MSEHIDCVGGPLHRQHVAARGRKMSAPDGGMYYVVGIRLRDEQGELHHNDYYVHDSIYSNGREKRRLAAEVYFQMTWQPPSEAGIYWVRWKQRLRDLTIVDSGVESPSLIRIRFGEKPDNAVHRHALWSLQPIPEQALRLRDNDPQLGNLIAADWCVENGYPHQAANFRELTRQAQRLSRRD